MYIYVPMQEYHWRIKYWGFYHKIANRQNLLLANILSYTIFAHICYACICAYYYSRVDITLDLMLPSNLTIKNLSINY